MGAHLWDWRESRACVGGPTGDDRHSGIQASDPETGGIQWHDPKVLSCTRVDNSSTRRVKWRVVPSSSSLTTRVDLVLHPIPGPDRIFDRLRPFDALPASAEGSRCRNGATPY